jgi:type II secretory pathway component PulF
MKRKKLLKKLNKLMGVGEDADKEQIKKLHKVLKILKEKQANLQEKLDSAQDDHERRKIKQKIEVIQRQRKKGVEVYRAMKEARG